MVHVDNEEARKGGKKDRNEVSKTTNIYLLKASLRIIFKNSFFYETHLKYLFEGEECSSQFAALAVQQFFCNRQATRNHLL